MDKLLGFLANLEAAIRYLLTGAIVSALWVGSRAAPDIWLKWVQEHQLLAAAVVLALGTSWFAVYRVVFWLLGDYAALWAKLSGPSAVCIKGQRYPGPLAAFLSWRYSEKVAPALGGYLAYRWAISHFSVAIGLALLAAVSWREPGSFVDAHEGVFLFLVPVCVLFGLAQCCLLFAVEKELYRKGHHAET